MSVANPYSDKPGAQRKQAAFEMGALEAVSSAMRESTDRAVQHAGKLAIGCICKGMDKNGQERRKRAHQLFKLAR